jgi:hypothetical protein
MILVIHRVYNKRSKRADVHCVRHNKKWTEGDYYEGNGGNACKKCCQSKNRQDLIKFINE